MLGGGWFSLSFSSSGDGVLLLVMVVFVCRSAASTVGWDNMCTGLGNEETSTLGGGLGEGTMEGLIGGGSCGMCGVDDGGGACCGTPSKCLRACRNASRLSGVSCICRTRFTSKFITRFLPCEVAEASHSRSRNCMRSRRRSLVRRIIVGSFLSRRGERNPLRRM